MSDHGAAEPLRQHLASVVRDEGGRILAVLARATGDLQLAEDAVQDASVAAMEVWPRTGVPADPSAWLYVAARRKALDSLRREGQRHDKERAADQRQALLEQDPPAPSVVRDDQLRLIFTCCHPALALESRVALTLRVVCGLPTPEIARALLVSEAAMAKRLTRARQKVATARIPFRVPEPADLPERMAAVCAVIHLTFTAGHSAAGRETIRADLCDEAIRLARLVSSLHPGDATVEGLLALLLLSDARRSARVDGDGGLVALADQDRTTWDQDLVAEGLARLDASLRASDGMADPYQLQAAIAACHATAPSYAATDWPELVRLYGLLAEVHPSPAVVLNAAVPIAEVRGPRAALATLEEIAPDQRAYLWHAARADMLERLGEFDAARDAFATAVAGAPSLPERDHLRRRMQALTG